MAYLTPRVHCAKSCRPSVDIGFVEPVRDGDDPGRIAQLSIGVGGSRPFELGDHQVFRSGDEPMDAKEVGLLPTTELLDRKGSILADDEVDVGGIAGDGIELARLARASCAASAST
jgi:hypothetical protein